MKQTSKYAIVFLAGAIFATAGSAYGTEAIKTISAKLRPDIKVSVNGKQLDASAISYNNTTYLPLRKTAEAVGGKIELDGKNINIISEIKSSDKDNTNESSATESSVYPIEEKLLYESTEVFQHILKLGRPTYTSRVIDGEVTFIYNDQKFPAVENSDYYYDKKNDKWFYSEELLLKFLSSSDLDGLHHYKVKVSTSTVSPI